MCPMYHDATRAHIVVNLEDGRDRENIRSLRLPPAWIFLGGGLPSTRASSGSVDVNTERTHAQLATRLKSPRDRNFSALGVRHRYRTPMDVAAAELRSSPAPQTRSSGRVRTRVTGPRSGVSFALELYDAHVLTRRLHSDGIYVSAQVQGFPSTAGMGEHRRLEGGRGRSGTVGHAPPACMADR
ncbi:hypothetical protein PYCCODRAFT_640701 [Trametes coccinea BRFM310]|uniref:Uncharacterized protein n=1 Tax=Trametes coccinea (strain BRFM310) TaxID=1353009 RepID=A0A1Y2II64_TRAC3|nr:hypothetical protein PYCCODRAFT_640701 [Trametes coccinea BRFM310]